MKRALAISASKIVKSIKYMNIASVGKDLLPWNTPVYCAFDKLLNFYWASWKSNQHSVNIRTHSGVFVTIYDSTAKEGEGLGVYMMGEAYELKNPVQALKGLKLLFGRANQKPNAVKEYFKKFPRRVYIFIPKKIWINGDGEIDGNFVDIRTEIELNEVVKFLVK